MTSSSAGHDPAELLEEAVDEAMSPVVDELWRSILPVVRAALDAAEQAADPTGPPPRTSSPGSAPWDGPTGSGTGDAPTAS